MSQFRLRKLRETTTTSFAPVREQEKELPIPQPATFDEKKEAGTRQMIAELAQYAEKGRTFDPTGRYLCFSCAMRIVIPGKDRGHCTHVASGTSGISMSIGGCRKYKIGEAMGKEHSLPLKSSQKNSAYAEVPKTKGFGCFPRCQYGELARDARSRTDGRIAWCGFWGCHVKAKACCDEQSAPDMVDHPGEKV